MKPLWIAVAATLLAAAGAILVGKGRSGQEASDRIALGRAVYLANCASCHGTKLEGQPDWRSPGTSQSRTSGRTASMSRYGTFSVTPSCS